MAAKECCQSINATIQVKKKLSGMVVGGVCCWLLFCSFTIDWLVSMQYWVEHIHCFLYTVKGTREKGFKPILGPNFWTLCLPVLVGTVIT